MYIHLLYLAVLTTGILAHGIRDVNLEINNEPKIESFSLPNLIELDSFDDLSSLWDPQGGAIYEEGRIILTPKLNKVPENTKSTTFGSIWSRESFSDLQDFTIEMTLRSIGAYGLTGAGISLFLIEEGFNFMDYSNFGGPIKYKGLQLLLNSDDNLGPVIKVFLNDGFKDIFIKNDFIGAYLYEFQDSNVPLTIRIAYDHEKRWTKITCDNKLLFQTDKLNFDQLLLDNLKLGVSALSLTDSSKHEQYELLRLITYNKVLPKMKLAESETLFAKHFIDNTKNFMEKQKELRNKLAQTSKSESIIPNVQFDNSNQNLLELQEQMKQLLKIVQNNEQSVLQKQVFQLSKSLDLLNANLNALGENVQNLNYKYDAIFDFFKRQNELLDNYDRRMGSFDAALQNQLDNSNKLDTKLSDMSSWYKKTQKKNGDNNENTDSFSNIKSTLVAVLIFVVVLLVFLALLVFRLRSDIKHAKVL